MECPCGAAVAIKVNLALTPYAENLLARYAECAAVAFGEIEDAQRKCIEADSSCDKGMA